MATYHLFTDKRGQFRFHLKADNGEIILASEGYTTRASALNGIAAVKSNAWHAVRYQRKATKAGFSFNLRAANHRTIGTSEVYTTEAAREKGIAVMMKVAAKAPFKAAH
jgi:uncharacterized protein